MRCKGLSEQCSDSQSVQRQLPEYPNPVHILAASAATDALGFIAVGAHPVPNAASVATFCGWQLEASPVTETASSKFGQPEVGEFGEPGLHHWGHLSVASEAF